MRLRPRCVGTGGAPCPCVVSWVRGAPTPQACEAAQDLGSALDPARSRPRPAVCTRGLGLFKQHRKNASQNSALSNATRIGSRAGGPSRGEAPEPTPSWRGCGHRGYVARRPAGYRPAGDWVYHSAPISPSQTMPFPDGLGAQAEVAMKRRAAGCSRGKPQCGNPRPRCAGPAHAGLGALGFGDHRGAAVMGTGTSRSPSTAASRSETNPT